MIFILVLLGLFALMWWSKPQASQIIGVTTEITSGTLTVEEKFYDFGTISMSDGNVEKTFQITNSTDKDITLKTVTTSCMCTTAYIGGGGGGEKGPFGMPGHGGTVPRANEVIRGGESRGIRVVYNPNAHGPAGVGLIDRFIYLEEATGGILELEIKAVVTP